MPSKLLRRSVSAVAIGALAGCAIAFAPALATTQATAAVVSAPIVHSAPDAAIALSPIGSFDTGVFDESAAEIVAAYDDRLFVVNAKAGSVSVLDASNPAAMRELYAISADGVANSVAIRADGLGVIALEAPVKTDPGQLVFFDANADTPTILGAVQVGALPDMVTISADGTRAVSANEGEPSDDFTVDPEGSISVVALPTGLAAPAQSDVRTADFHAFEGGVLPSDVRVFGPAPHTDFPVSRNLEPEYVALDGDTAYVSLQEANAIAIVDLASATVTSVRPLGYKAHALTENALDPSDKDGVFDLRTYEGLFGMYMPDGIVSYDADGSTYLVTANEGDAREWGSYEEPLRVKDLGKKGVPQVCADSPLATQLADTELGRLNVTRENGLDADRNCYMNLFAFGARSFSIWATDGTQVFDSGSDFERITAQALPGFVNSNHTEANFEGRSDDKASEPESVAVGSVGDRTYAFVGLERVGGVMVYDITSPSDAFFVTYINNRDFAADPETNLAAAGDLGAEGVTFIPAGNGITGEPLLAVANEVSGSTTLFAIEDLLAPATTDIQVLSINDFHGRIEQNLGNGEAGAAVLAGAIDAFEAQNPNTLFVSAGDNIGASTFTSFIAQDEPTIDALKAAGLDVSAVGNHEFDTGFNDLTTRILPRWGGDQFGLGANVTDTASGTPALSPYNVQTVDGVRIAFIGTVTEQTASMVSPTGITGLSFDDQLASANRTATAIADANAADVIILLAHDGSETPSCAALTTDQTSYAKLVREASGAIDAIVSGHTHQAYSCNIAGPDGERPVIQAHQYGTTLGKLDLKVDTATKELVSVTGSVVPLVVDGAAAYPADPDVAAIVQEAADFADVEGSKPVGQISTDILRGGTNGSDRGVESAMGNLTADVYLWATSNPNYTGTKAQIGIMNPGGLRADLLYGADGAVSYRDVANVQPFANTLVTVTLTGAQLKQILEEQWQPVGSSRPKLHLGISDGFTYTYAPNGASGSRITSMTFNGTEVLPTDTYTVVTNSFLAGGGDNFVTFAAGTDRTDTGQVDLKATVEYFAAHDVVDPAPLGRAKLAGDEGELPWANVDVGTGQVRQGESLQVTVSGLEPGTQLQAVLHSDPLEASAIPVAGEDGIVKFVIAIPADFAVGAHTLVVQASDYAPISTAVTVLAASPSGETPTKPGDELANTGAQTPLGIALLAAMLVAAGLMLVPLRARRINA